MLLKSVRIVLNFSHIIHFCIQLIIYFTIQIKGDDNQFNYTVQNLQCNKDEFKVALKVSPNFGGIIFGRDYFQDEKCRWYNNNNNEIEMSIDINMCGIKKNEDEYELSLIMSPEKNIIVVGAKEILIKCTSREEKSFSKIPENDEIVISLTSNPNISNKLHFSPITTSTLTGNGSTSKISLQILKQHNAKGLLTKTAKIGEPLTLLVHLENTRLYNILLSDCYAHDGKGNDKAILKIIDSQGCGVPLERAVEEDVTTQVINDNEKNIFINIYGFQFTSNKNVFFECKIKTCIQPCTVKQCKKNSKSDINKESEEKDFTNLVVKYMLEIKP